MHQSYLIDRWSYSSMKDFLGNRYKFLQSWVLKVWTFKCGPAALVGSAGHAAIELILKGATHERGIEEGLALIDRTKDSEIKWGKTGSREQVIKTYTSAINAYLTEFPDLGKILAIEEPLTEFITVDDIVASDESWVFDLPAKCVPDVVSENKTGELEIHDHKFVTAYTDGGTDKADKILQALFNFHVVKAKYGRRPKRMIYHECKTSENRNGDPRVQDWVFEFDAHADYFVMFYKLYSLCSEELAKEDCTFLPNLGDMFDGEETLKLFAAEQLGVDRPRTIRHKAEEVEIKERKYIPSASDKIENTNLTAEEKIRTKLQEFGVAVEMRQTHVGHSVIQFTLKPSRAKRMKDFMGYEKDIAIALKAHSVRIEAPIMGTDLVGIEIPNPERTFVSYSADEKQTNTLHVPIGIDVFGNTIVKDLGDMPHLLVAGATGSGKSVFINVLIRALTDQNTPDRLKLVLIDPKRVELSNFRSLPHVLAKPIYEIKEAYKAFRWLLDEMERRYEQLEAVGVRNVDEFNASQPLLAKIVVVIDEFADLILQTKEQKQKGEPNLTENSIVRLAQKARAVGIHLVIGTQRPSVDVVTGLIKANIPTRIAFATAQQADSRVILDQSGAETLIGKGDMLFLDPSRRNLQRLQSFNL